MGREEREQIRRMGGKHKLGSSGDSYGGESACSLGDLGSIPELGRPPGEEKGRPLQYSYLENSMDRVWQVTVHGVAKNWT